MSTTKSMKLIDDAFVAHVWDQFSQREACTKKSGTNFFVSNDTMKGPGSRKIFFLIIKISVTVKIHPLCISGSERKFQMGQWGAVYVTSQALNILRESYCFCPLD